MAEEYEKIIKENAQKYYTTGEQDLSDEAFDALIDKVKEENPDSKVVNSVGWGYDISASKDKVKHIYGTVGSLKKVRTQEEIYSKLSMNNTEYTYVDISPKLDGISAVLYFNDGTLYLALTRGDGESGIDITKKIIYILKDTDVLDNIKRTEFTGAVRGELIIPVDRYSEFKKLHPDSKNARNSVAGLINGDDIVLPDYNYISFCPYSVVGCDDFSYKFGLTTINRVNSFLSANFGKLAVPRYSMCITSNYKSRFDGLKSAWEKLYPIDGLVITLLDLDYDIKTQQLTQTSVAYKFAEEEKITKIISIDWNANTSGAYIPVANIEPVELAGTTVKRVACYNANYVLVNKLGPGSIVAICKRGEIIPKITEVIRGVSDYKVPEYCPHCNRVLTFDGVDLVCNNLNCGQKTNEDVKAVCMNLAPIDGLGWKTISKFLNEDINVDDLIINTTKLETTKPNSEKALFNRMLDVLKYGYYTMSQFLLALNIPGLGKIGAEAWENNPLMSKSYIEDIIYSERKLSMGLNMILKDKNLVDSLYTTYQDKIKRYWFLFGGRVTLANNTSDEDNVPDKGSVCITGTLSMKRDEFIKLVKEYGWLIDSSIKKTTTYLVTNTPDSDTSKNRKADELGIKKLTEEEFVNNYMKG